MQLPFLCGKSRAIALVLPGLTAGWLSSRMASWLAGRQNSAKFRNFKSYMLDEIFNFLLCLRKIWCYYT